jgi:reductive dehalogenase
MKDSAITTAAKIHELKEKEYTRFNDKNHCILRSVFDPEFEFYQKSLSTNMVNLVDSGEPGFSRLDLALYSAAWTLNRHFRFASRWDIKPSPNDFMPPEIRNRPPDEKYTPEQLTTNVKRAAVFLGASTVGVARIDPNWFYTSVQIDGEKDELETQEVPKEGNIPRKKLPKGIKYAIVCAIEMDPSGIRAAPTFLEVASAGLGYSKMAFTSGSLAEFIRNLGYRALPCQNDTALSIPMAIDAGLGALGRLGILVTKKFGPRIRLCKILTDMPLVPDGPDIKFIKKIDSYCAKCKRCAEVCESEAISFEKEQSYDAKFKSKSNNLGTKKWYTDVEKCYKIWVETSGDCGKCIQICPFSRTEIELTSEEFWAMDI